MKKLTKDNRFFELPYAREIEVILLLILIAVSIFFYSIMPREVCHDEFEIVKIELQANCELSFWVTVDDWESIPENTEELFCEEDVKIYKNLKLVETYSCEPKVCLAKTSTEICEVVFK